mmetsp:Transcript_7151/g.20726  ORF Transcript_7151/g.20726 Transcript_7151/m.20726 type:complete len:221 (+) Transcript_7151:624-1286(+)
MPVLAPATEWEAEGGLPGDPAPRHGVVEERLARIVAVRRSLSTLFARSRSSSSTPTSRAFLMAEVIQSCSRVSMATSSSLAVSGRRSEYPGDPVVNPFALSASSKATMRGGTICGRRIMATRATLSMPLHTSRRLRRDTTSFASKRRRCWMPSLSTANFKKRDTLSRASKVPRCAPTWQATGSSVMKRSSSSSCTPVSIMSNKLCCMGTPSVPASHRDTS